MGDWLGGNDRRAPAPVPAVRCAVYTRKSTEEGLDQEFNSLDAQREAAEAFIRSQRHQGWTLVPERYDDGGFSGGNLDRPALQRLLDDIEAGHVNCVVVYKVDRLSRSLLDFARLMDRFDQRTVSFVAVTQQLNTTTSLGRLTLNILLSFAQFEREIIGERTSDKMTAARRKGKWVGGVPVLGYDIAADGGHLVVNPQEAEQVREIFRLYTQHRSLSAIIEELGRREWTTKAFRSKRGDQHGGRPLQEATLLRLLTNAIYVGQVEHKGQLYAGEQPAIVERSMWGPIQDELRARRPGARGTVHNKQNGLLNGLLFCHLCDRPMAHTYTAAHGRRYRYYVCRRAHQTGRVGCPTKAVSARAIEESVVTQLRLTLGGEKTRPWNGEIADLVHRMVERVSYDGTTGGVSLRLATIDS
jgi:site-specific DNA recombinase